MAPTPKDQLAKAVTDVLLFTIWSIF